MKRALSMLLVGGSLLGATSALAADKVVQEEDNKVRFG